MTSFSYDSLGRTVWRTVCTPLNCGSGGWSNYYTYDLAGNPTQFTDGYYTWPQYFNQSFDTAGRVTQITSTVSDSQHPATLFTVDSSIGYYPAAILRKGAFGNGLTQSNVYNNLFQPCLIDVNNNSTTLQTCNDSTPGGNVLDFWMGYNAGSSNNGNVVNWNASGAQSFVRTFGYDSLNRLSTMQETTGAAEGCKPPSSQSNPYNLTWTYDPWGNRTSQSPNAGTCSFSATVNSQNQLSGSPYQYDAAGNMTNDGNHSYFYDAENHLIQVDGTLGTCSAATACYTYDAFGMRARKVAGSSTYDYVYDRNGQVSQELLNTHSNRAFVRSGGQLLAEYYGGTTYFAHTDHLTSTRLLTGMNQSVAQNLDYLPFGEILSSDSGTTTNKFTGDERDIESNLDHTQFRQYSSQLGRWMHPDPAGLAAVDPSNPQSWNRYSYVLNNPLIYFDPSGLYPVYFGNCEYDEVDFYVDGQYQGSDFTFVGCSNPNPTLIASGGGGGGAGGSSSQTNRPPFLPSTPLCTPPTSKIPTTIGVSAGGTVARNVSGNTYTGNSSTTLVASTSGAVGVLANVGAQNLPSSAPPGNPTANGQFAGAGYQLVVSNLQPSQLATPSTSYQISVNAVVVGGTVAYSSYPNGGYKVGFTPWPGLPFAFGLGFSKRRTFLRTLWA